MAETEATPTDGPDEATDAPLDAKAKFRAALDAKNARARGGEKGHREGGGPEGHTASAHGHKVHRRKSG